MRKHILSTAVMMACAGTSLAAIADESTTVGGKAYFDVTSIDQTSDGVSTSTSGVGMDVKRFYLAIDHKFDDMWSANLTTDFNYVSNDGETQLYVKKAYMQAKFSDEAVLRIGSADLPWVPFAEKAYGFRWVENTLIDRRKDGTSADWGVHLGGKFMDGKVEYAVAAINGKGYKDPTRSKGFDYEGRVSFYPIEGLTLGAGFRDGTQGLESETVDTANRATRMNLLAAYDFKIFKVGAEYYTVDNPTSTAILTGPQDEADGYSVFGSFSPADKVTVFARYDQSEYRNDLVPNITDTYYNVGVSYEARKNVDLAFVYKNDLVENGSVKTSNGTIGGVNEGEYTEFGLWAQVKF